MRRNPERSYRLAMAAYPRDYRLARGEEMLGVLMEAPDRRTTREVLALARHGLTMRLFGQGGRVWRPASAAAALALATCLAALAFYQLMDLSGYVLHGQVHGLYVDPQWPAYALWTATLALLVARQARLAFVTSTAAAVAYAVIALHQGWTYFPEDGSTPAWQRLEQLWSALALLAPSVVLAVLLADPRVGRAARDAVSGRVLAVAVVAGALPGLAELFNGVSAVWPVLYPLAVLLVAFLGRGVFLRAAVLLAFAFVYVPLGAQTDGSGSRLPGSPTSLAIVLLALPVLGVVVALLVIPLLEGNTWEVRTRLAGWLDRLSTVVRGSAGVSGR